MLYPTLKIVLFAMMCFISTSTITNTNIVDEHTLTTNNIVDIGINNKLLLAIIYVESGGDPTKWAKGEDAVGCLQIRRIAIRDVNRILKKQKNKKRYKYKDRWDCEKSKYIFVLLTEYYLPGGCDEDIARFWNGGPTGPTKTATKVYWRKVKREIHKKKYKHLKWIKKKKEWERPQWPTNYDPDRYPNHWLKKNK